MVNEPTPGIEIVEHEREMNKGSQKIKREGINTIPLCAPLLEGLLFFFCLLLHYLKAKNRLGMVLVLYGKKMNQDIK